MTQEKDVDTLANHSHSVCCTTQQKAVIFTDSFDASRFPTREQAWILYSFPEQTFNFLEIFEFPIQQKAKEKYVCVCTEEEMEKE